MSTSDHLFVYGTLRKESEHPMSDLLQTYSRHVGSATFQGKLYDTGSFPAARPTNDKSDKVYGELYEIGDPTSLFAHLDSYEGYDPRRKTKSLFLRKKVIVQSSNGEVEAWTYLYNRSVDNLKSIAGGDYLSHLKK